MIKVIFLVILNLKFLEKVLICLIVLCLNVLIFQAVDGCLCININALARGAYLKMDVNVEALTGSSKEASGLNVDEYCNISVVRL